ncbi:hypothetical protein FJQ98_00300 [Lysinibacillus agricola]|uniref:Uncharacterized protein n=1 Tax=Lysinibacillus agricola TaxID=2590012 RepID=A0ABX7ARN7_9BACI|nr:MULTISPECIES: hypothetical protein [Lysinibacillus]QQP12615.1 hypothetical protein FJQ98_00300 [Lysinibacillus agricola]
MGISVTDETLERATRVKRLIGRPQEALLCAKAKRQLQLFYLCESEASATKRPVGTEINPRYGEEPFYNYLFRYTKKRCPIKATSFFTLTMVFIINFSLRYLT